MRTTTKRLMYRTNYDAHILIGETVIDRLAVPASADQPVHSQPCQLLRYGWLPQRQTALDLGHRFLAIAQNAEDHQPAFVRERREKVARLSGLASHALEIGNMSLGP